MARRSSKASKAAKAAAKSRKQAKASNLAKKKKQQVEQRRKKKQPKTQLYLICPETDEEVWLTKATLPDIRRAQKTKRQPLSRHRKYLLTVPSTSIRQQVYKVLEEAWQDLESRILPEYGGRPWKVQVTLKDKDTKGPFFCWGRRGALELAAWPELMANIPNPPRFPGFGNASATKKKKEAAKKKRELEQKESEEKETDQETEEDVAEGTLEETASSSAAVTNEGDTSVGPTRAEETQEAVDAEEEEESESDEEEESDEEDEEDELTKEELVMQALQERESTPLSRLAYKERWRAPLPNISIKWISPLHQVFHTRKSAWENAVQLCKQEVLMDRVLRGYGASGMPLQKVAKPSKKMSLKVGKIRFERDGLWVVGQEEKWVLERLEEQEDREEAEQQQAEEEQKEKEVAMGQRKPRELTPLSYYIQCNRKNHQEKRLKEIKEADAASGKDGADAEETTKPSAKTSSDSAVDKAGKKKASSGFTLRDAECELRVVWKGLSEEEKSDWAERCRKAKAAKMLADVEVAAAKASSLLEQHKIQQDEKNNATVEAGRVTPPSEAESDGFVSSPGAVVRVAKVIPDGEKERNGCVISPSPPPLSQKDANGPDCSKLKRSKSKVVESTHWRLNSEQVQKCYDAGMAHFDQVLDTVRARDLMRELQDGFDVLRERGRGRYDMELPVFDEPAFDFLTDLKKTPWMPIVREILGDDAVLIHKGMFLSLPDAAKQVYHQDGIHLTNQYQKPCHAINVFVPLIDLTMQHGPTEFCLGSHILGQEDLDEDFIETPTATAGTPIIFDYRLGHRGLGNTSDTSRPIVYCTYARAADGKEFRDSVNFSRKRYHRIGELISKVPTRDERARKRERICEKARNSMEESEKKIRISS